MVYSCFDGCSETVTVFDFPKVDGIVRYGKNSRPALVMVGRRKAITHLH